MQVLAASGSSAVAAPLAISVNWTGPDSFNVSGSSGVASAQGLIGVSISGGTPPYNGNGPGGALVYVANDPSGKIGTGPYGDNAHLTLAWSGFSLNEVEGGNIIGSVIDSVGATATDTYPSAGVVIIKRTS
jgi:hypothetical protein